MTKYTAARLFLGVMLAILLTATAVLIFSAGRVYGRYEVTTAAPLTCGEDAIRVVPRYVPRGPVPGATP